MGLDDDQAGEFERIGLSEVSPKSYRSYMITANPLDMCCHPCTQETTA